MIDHSAEEQVASLPLEQHNGRILRAARENKSLSIAEVASALRMTSRQIDALENERYEVLLGRASARGLMKNYARFLGVDEVPLITEFDRVYVGAHEKTVANAVLPIGMEPIDRKPIFALAAFALMAVVLVGSLLLGYQLGWFDGFKDYVPTGLNQPVAIKPVEPVAEKNTQHVPLPASLQELIVTGGASTASASVAAPTSNIAAVGVESAAPMVTVGTGAPVPAPVVVVSATASAAAVNAAAPVVAVAVTPAAAPVIFSNTVAAAPAGNTVASERSIALSFASESWFEITDSNGRIVKSAIGKKDEKLEQSLSGVSMPLRVVIGNAPAVSVALDGQAFDLKDKMRGAVARFQVQ